MNVAVSGDATGIEATVRASDATMSATADADVVITTGESALLSVADGPVSVPILAVGSAAGPHTVPVGRLDEALDSLVAGDWQSVSHSTLAVTVDGRPVDDALLDVSLMTARAAEISEYAVHAASVSVPPFRADGVVVATPLGSTGYARAVDGPILAPQTGLAVVPVAPYATVARHWVLRPPIRLTVERDDADVVLVLDDAVRHHVTADEVVELRQSDPVELVDVPETRAGE
jgi:NAD+ kinase